MGRTGQRQERTRTPLIVDVVSSQSASTKHFSADLVCASDMFLQIVCLPLCIYVCLEQVESAGQKCLIFSVFEFYDGCLSDGYL